MSKRSSEQSSYSVDEMMERLKEGDREKRSKDDSELVTRPDGSQVVRVRRRKRRSSQPRRKQQVRRKRLGVTALVVAGLVVVGCVVAAVLLLARFNSKGYRDALKEKISASTGARASFKDMSVTPFKARADSFGLEWSGRGFAKSLKMSTVSADLRLANLLGAPWSGKEALALKGQLILGPPDPAAPRIPEVDGNFPFEFEQYRSPNVEVLFGSDLDDPKIRLTGTELTLRTLDDGGSRILVNGGHVKLSGWDELKVDRGTVELQEGTFSLVSLRATSPLLTGLGKPGQLTVTTARPARGDKPIALEVQIKDFPLKTLLGPGLGRLIGGAVSSPAGSIMADPRAPESLEARVDFAGTMGTLERFPFLEGLRTVLNDSFYAAPDLGTVMGVYRRNKEGTKIQNFEFESKSQLIVRGNIALASDGGLGGSLELGVPQGLMMKPLGGKRFAAFTDPDNGYCWITVELSGTAARPQDNFTTMLARGASKAPDGGGVKDLLEDRFDELTK